MFTSFSTALSALNATSTGIDVVGNNLANLNTTGYKESVVSFHDLVSQSLGSGLGETQVGFGVARPITTREFTQGPVESSTGQLDVAIEGDGFFVVKDPSTNATLYTRAGDFTTDKAGNLLTSTGQHVQGWTMTGGVTNTNAAISDIQIPVGQMRQPQATTECSLSANLNASAVAGVKTGDTMDTFSTPVQVVDSLGNPLVLTVTFTKDASAPRTWDYQVSVPGDAITGGTAGTTTNLLATPGSLTFGADGKLATPTSAGGAIPLTIAKLADNAADLKINFNLYDSSGAPTITQLAQTSAASANSQNGVPDSELLRIGLGDGGQVLAQYANGTQQVVGQLAMASIRNPSSLIAVGQNNFQASQATAEAAVGLPDTGGRGAIKGGSLEGSTVDIAKEFTDLIVLQRAYQANGKVITASDQISQDTINLMR